jgi:hypothetical protein
MRVVPGAEGHLAFPPSADEGDTGDPERVSLEVPGEAGPPGRAFPAVGSLSAWNTRPPGLGPTDEGSWLGQEKETR